MQTMSLKKLGSSEKMIRVLRPCEDYSVQPWLNLFLGNYSFRVGKLSFD